MKARVGILVLSLLNASSLASAAASPAQLEAGKKTYEKFCSQCHGEKGDGEGPAANFVRPRPRDFTSGKYKIRTTASGSLPTDDDLKRVIRNGMPYTSMPAWSNFTEQELASLVEYVKSFHAGFADASNAAKPIDLPKAPAWTKESAEKGKGVYAATGCATCHGATGRGDGASAPSLKDDKGNTIRPADLTARWTFRGGASREDIFRTFTTGLNGTPMPAFAESMEPAERWALTDFVYSLGDGDTPNYQTLLVAAPQEDDIDVAKGAALFDKVPAVRFPVVGQIMEPGRAFAPAASALQVRAVYDQQKIAFLVRWHDIKADTTGTNAPNLPVPLSDEALGAAAPAGEAAGTDFWGEPTAAPSPAAKPSSDDFWGDSSGNAAAGGAAPGASEFSDAVAIQLPTKLPEGATKPYFIVGDAQQPVDLWFLDLAKNKVAAFVGQGSAAIAPSEVREVQGSGSFAEGEWSAIFVRDLKPAQGVAFTEGVYVPVAFSVWDGLSRERGSRRGLTQWMSVYLAPREKASVIGPMVQAALIVAALEGLAVFLIRRRRSPSSEGHPTGADKLALH